MLTLSSELTQTLLTHVGWWYGAIFAIPMHISGVRVVQNMAILWVKIRPLWQAGSRVRFLE